MTNREKVEFLNEIRESFERLEGISYERIFDSLVDTYGQMARAEQGIDTFNYSEGC